MIKSIKLVPYTIALLTGVTVLVNALGVAHASDPSLRRPLYVIKLSKNHDNINASLLSGDPPLGKSPYNDFNSNTPPWRVGAWGHVVRFRLQILDNNGQPYTTGNPIERFNNYEENPNFSAYRDIAGQTLGPRYGPNQQGNTWSPQQGSIQPGSSEFFDTNRAYHRPRPYTNQTADGTQYLSVPTTRWFEFDQRWYVYVRQGENAPSETQVFMTDSIHHLEATQGDRSRQNLGAMPP